MNKVAIVAAKRTAIGAFNGNLSSLSAPQLAGAVIKACLNDTGIDSQQIDTAILGNVLSAGIGQAPARQAAIYGNLPPKTTSLTINKVCGSGMMAVMLAADKIKTGQADIVVAGGMESMSNAPYLMPGARNGFRLGDSKIIDGLIKDGLWDPYNNLHMGSLAELLVQKHNFSRQQLDEFAIDSVNKAKQAISNNYFKDEIVPIEVKNRKNSILVDVDEQPSLAKPEKVPNLKPVFKKDGTITAANASSINDGAAILVLVSEQKLKDLGLKPLAWINSYNEHAQDPAYFTEAPVTGIAKLLAKNKLAATDIDIWEINEAFAVVAMAAIKEHQLDTSKVNIHGGACALGHPIGCSGARLLVTLIHLLHQKNKKKGLASLCIGGGESTSMIIDNGQ